jgi:hypothetical protein
VSIKNRLFRHPGKIQVGFREKQQQLTGRGDAVPGQDAAVTWANALDLINRCILKDAQ